MIALASSLLLLPACSPAPDDSSAISHQPSAFTPRIISLAPNLTEILFAIGAAPLLVGRTDSCDFPPEAATVPSTGPFGEPDLERLLVLRPTHVLYADLLDKTLPETLRRHNIQILHLPCDQLDAITPAIRELGGLTGRRGKADELATTLETRLAELRAAADALPPEQRPGVFFFLWGDPLMTVGCGSFITGLLHLAGARNIADDTPAAYFNASPEAFIARDPSVIISLMDAPAGALHKNLSQHPGWAATRAVRENRIIEDLPLDLINRPGPRVLEAVEAFQKALEGY
ncbi:MAG: cobalamin-binding protein [Kiritimatiellaeota bacterium]|nr:cobalamin-binding protein [Kiritimatiellota bacterium]